MRGRIVVVVVGDVVETAAVVVGDAEEEIEAVVVGVVFDRLIVCLFRERKR